MEHPDMTLTDNQLQALEKKIRAAVPESIRKWRKHNCGKIIGCDCKDKDLERIMAPRPLQLADVLIALRKEVGAFAVDGSGMIIQFTGGKKWKFCPPIFDLTKDFHSQSPELYQFLYSLLI